MRFGPCYPKIDTLFKRDEHNVIIPWDWTTDEFKYLRGIEWWWTEKIDGTNIRLHYNGTTVAIGGRTDDAQVPAQLVANLADVCDPARWAATFGADPVTVYGEGYGAGIQSGGQYRPDRALIVYDVRVGDWWLGIEDYCDVAAALGLEQVTPIVGVDPMTVDEAVERVWATARDATDPRALASFCPNARIEGLVGRPVVELHNRKGERILAKIKVKDFADYERSIR